MNKTEKHINVIQEYYYPKLAKSSLADHAVLGWESREAQNLRFAAFTDHLDLEGRSILDVGCGLGHLIDHLKGLNITFDYAGVDILPEMIERAEKRHDDRDFFCCDLFKENPVKDRNFDVVYTSGIFNLNMGNNPEFLFKAACHFLKLASESVVFNVLSDLSRNKEEDKYFYFTINQLEQILNEVSHVDGMPDFNVRIIQEYLDNDYTIILNRLPKEAS